MNRAAKQELTEIVIFGAGGSGAAHLQSAKQHVAIKGFIDNDKDRSGTMFCGHPVYSAEALETLRYDKIIIASNWALDITHQLLHTCNIEKYKVADYTRRLLYPLESMSEGSAAVAIVTGNSYTFNAFREGCFPFALVDLSMTSQDLATDRRLLYKALNAARCGTVKRVFISLYHYIFDYEIEKRLAVMAQDVYTFLDDACTEAFRYSELFHDDLNENIRNNYNPVFHPSQFQAAKEEARHRSAKCYPESQEKNIAILEDMIETLLDHSILPLLTIMPLHTSYTCEIDQEHLKRFYSIVNAAQKKYDIPLFDHMFHEYPLSAFGDATHLNRFGGYIFSTALNEYVRSLRR